MVKICGIYKITSPSGKIYIGQSININARFGVYKRKRKVNQPKLYRSFNKYGIEAHKFEIIVQGNFNYYLLNELEKHYIQLYNTLNVGLNCTSGGKGSCNYKVSEETRKKRSNSLKGRSFSKEWREKISVAAKMRKPIPYTEERREKLRIAGLNRTHSEETKLKIRNSKLGTKMSEETRKKMSEQHKVAEYGRKKTICTKTNKIWNSGKVCWEELYQNIFSYSYFKSMLNGSRKNLTSIIYLENINTL